MISQDLFVGGVAITLGLCMFLVAACNWEWFFSLRKAQWLEKRWGRGGVRCLYAVIGLGLIGLGVAISMGYAPNARAKNAARLLNDGGSVGRLSRATVDTHRIDTATSDDPT